MPGFVTSLLDALFPPRCAACDELLPARERPSRPLELCAVCEVSVEPVGPACARCGLPGDAVEACPFCEADPPAFDGATAAWLYGGAAVDLLHRFKYEHRPHYAAPLGELLSRLALPEADLVTHVPLHAARRRERSYDQALYLAQALARSRGLPCESLLLRVRSTGRQVGRSREERRRNVAGAFSAARPVRARSVWLVDDVLTTGATVEACAQALADAGACRVHVVSVARAVAG